MNDEVLWGFFAAYTVYSFSCFVILARASSAMLNRNGHGGTFVLFLISEEKRLTYDH